MLLVPALPFRAELPALVLLLASELRVAALPVVLWFRVGTSEAWMALRMTLVPLPRRNWADVVPPARALRAACCVVAPVPPLARARVPPRVRVPVLVMGPPELVRPVVPPDRATLVTEPVPALPAAAVPSWPLLSMTTVLVVAPVGVTPEMPAM